MDENKQKLTSYSQDLQKCARTTGNCHGPFLYFTFADKISTHLLDKLHQFYFKDQEY